MAAIALPETRQPRIASPSAWEACSRLRAAVPARRFLGHLHRRVGMSSFFAFLASLLSSISATSPHPTEYSLAFRPMPSVHRSVAIRARLGERFGMAGWYHGRVPLRPFALILFIATAAGVGQLAVLMASCSWPSPASPGGATTMVLALEDHGRSPAWPRRSADAPDGDRRHHDRHCQPVFDGTPSDGGDIALCASVLSC